jgi:hypothetical protein
MPNAPEIQRAGSKAFYSNINDRIYLLRISPEGSKALAYWPGLRLFRKAELSLYRCPGAALQKTTMRLQLIPRKPNPDIVAIHSLEI